jgi:hypothetical protein
MFKISFVHDLFNNDPTKRKRIIGIRITHGYHCSISYCCDCGRKCKYRKGFKFHNWSVSVHRFFEYRLHIKLPHLLYINKEYTDLSGTTKCPFKKERRYTCFDCKYHGGFDEYMKGLCANKEYIRLNKEGRAIEHNVPGQSYCKFFEKSEWADRWDKNTGERIFD